MCKSLKILKREIRQIQEELNKRIEKTWFDDKMNNESIEETGLDNNEIYEFSCKLDTLISKYYINSGKRNPKQPL